MNEMFTAYIRKLVLNYMQEFNGFLLMYNYLSSCDKTQIGLVEVHSEISTGFFHIETSHKVEFVEQQT